jgi:hypothetical protein
MHGNKDYWAKGNLMRMAEVFTKKTDYSQFIFDGGHNFPRVLSDKDYSQLADFIRRRWIETNGSFTGFSLPIKSYGQENPSK